MKTIADIKEELHQLIVETDDINRLILIKEIFIQLIELNKNGKSPAYRHDGTPLTIEEYNLAIEKAEEDIRAGRTITSEELNKIIKTWRKK